MNKIEAKNKVIRYLKERNINFQENISNGAEGLAIVLLGYSRCPDTILECCFSFYPNDMEIRVYYSENAAHWIAERPERLPDMYRLLNFIAARVWPFNSDGIGGEMYQPHHLATPRIYITEDGYWDLTSTMLVDYDVFEIAPLEICDTATASIPELMDKLSTPLFLVLLGKMNVEEAILCIKQQILNEC